LKISVVIRTRNKERYLDELLESLATQTVRASEIIVVDNYSTEENRRTLAESLNETSQDRFSRLGMRLKLVTLTDREFSHAYSTNLGVHTAENELVCITNAHSLPLSLTWLEDGSKHFENREVAGVSGFFIPHKDQTVAGKLDALVYYLGQKVAAQEDWFCTISSMIRKQLWKVYPFDENLPKIVPETKKYGLEDYDWGQEMTARGYRIVVDPSFSVFHSHTKGLDEAMRNVKNFFVYRRIQEKIRTFSRPRGSFSRVFQMSSRGQI
jgi:glycosyltransferase involved in cell wall biosynthesis